MIKTAVIGHPIKHSKSPIIHDYWMNAYDIDGVYNMINIAPDDLASRVKGLVDEGYQGVNVTIPHKIAVMDVCDDIDETAKAIGAVNTIIFKNGRIIGKNTDAFGLIENMNASAPNISYKGKTAYVIGAGGAAKAAVYALITAGVERILIANRTDAKAQLIIEEFDIYSHMLSTVLWGDRNDFIKEADIIINTTALGMTGYDDLDIDLTDASDNAIAYDIVYTPLMTGFLKQADARNMRIVTGVGMLVHQARLAFQYWHGVMPESDEALIQKVLA